MYLHNLLFVGKLTDFQIRMKCEWTWCNVFASSRSYTFIRCCFFGTTWLYGNKNISPGTHRSFVDGGVLTTVTNLWHIRGVSAQCPKGPGNLRMCELHLVAQMTCIPFWNLFSFFFFPKDFQYQRNISVPQGSLKNQVQTNFSILHRQVEGKQDIKHGYNYGEVKYCLRSLCIIHSKTAHEIQEWPLTKKHTLINA